MRNKKLIISVIVSAVLIGAIYVPQFFISDNDNDNEYTDKLNKDVVYNYEDYIKLNGEADFDNDGLNNRTELKYGSNPYSPDTDNDGLSDYYEYTNNSDMLDYDNTLCKNMEQELKKENKTYKNPYTSNGIILWAEDIESRTFGTVILSQAGDKTAYVFDRFNGYVQFPDGIPYDISSGIHKQLEYDKETELYIVESGMKVVIYEKELECMYKTSLFGNVSYKKDTFINSIIDKLLPRKGLITSEKITSNDTRLDINDGVILENIPIADKGYDYTQFTRFNYNNNKLSDLADVYNNIKKGYSVCVSLIDDNGETLGVVYGYDKYGNLLVADIETGQELGKIYISEHYTKLYTDKNSYTDYYWYSFTGLGYNSEKNARISFYSSSVTKNYPVLP